MNTARLRNVWNATKGWIAFIGMLALVLLAALLGAYLGAWHDHANGKSMHEASADLTGCNTLGLDIHGFLVTYAVSDASGSTNSCSSGGGCDVTTDSETIVALLDQIKDHPNVKAILLDVDSTGGIPQASEEITAALHAAGKPSVALIRSSGDSAAYWVASAAGKVIASPVSDVGSIGVTSSYVDNAKQDSANGLTYNSLSTGKYKDTGSPDKPLTADERAYLEHENAELLDVFIKAVADNRHLSVDAVRAIADGGTWVGQEAKQQGLVDEIGTYPEAMQALKDQLHATPSICWPQTDATS